MQTEKHHRIKFTLIFILLAVCACTFVYRLLKLQIVNAESYTTRSEKQSKSISVDYTIIPPRGSIYDRYGRLLNTNTTTQRASFAWEMIPPSELNDVALATALLWEEYDCAYNDALPISRVEPFVFTFAETADTSRETRELNFKNRYELPADATPYDVIAYFVERYEIDDALSLADQRRVIAMRYGMEQNYFGKGQPYAFSNEVTMPIVTRVRERLDIYRGIFFDYVPTRVYNTTTEAAHIIGHVGTAYKEDVERNPDRGYRIGDQMGRSGMEAAMEGVLRGTVGEVTRVYDENGVLQQTIEKTPWKAGRDVILTIDMELQAVLQDSLDRIIPKIRTLKDGEEASAGAAVLIDVNTFELLAMVNNPTFDVTQYNKQFAELQNDPLKPLFNRAIAGTYAPGSTFKSLTAIASLEEGIIDTTYRFNDTGRYTFYEDYQPVCWYYSDFKVGHGWQNVTQALENSCNCFFYEMGRILGINTIDRYAKLFGLGEYTGIELSGESRGILASPEFRKERGDIWYPGDTLQAAIGQSDHVFTPLQIACYIATMANGGTRYKAHLVRGIADSSGASPIEYTQPEILNDTNMTAAMVQVVKDGMRSASETGTASSTLSNYKYPVASKTGTASVSKGAANAVFVAFTPIDNPEVAFAGVVEHGGHGSYLAEMAAEIFTAYYERKATGTDEAYNTVSHKPLSGE